MSLENEDFFERMLSKISDDFPECPRLHVDWEFILKDKITQEIKSKKKFQILTIQNNAKIYLDVTIIISKLGYEYVQIPGLIEKFLLEIRKTTELISRNGFEDKDTICISQLRFTGNVYLYTDKLLVSEESVQKHFQLNHLVLLVRK